MVSCERNGQQNFFRRTTQTASSDTRTKSGYIELRVGRSAIMLRKIEADERGPSAELAERLADALDLAGNERTAFLDRALGRDLTGPAQHTANADRHAVPTRTNIVPPPTWLIGRRQEVARIHELLGTGNTQLVTLTGAGGIGKTRLAMEVAAALLDAYRDGVWIVELAAITDSALVTTAIAQTLQVHDRNEGDESESLRRVLRSKHMLLVLDNFEQVVDSAPTIRNLLDSAPELRILVTSRTPLRLRGERIIDVPPLAIPPLNLPLTVDRTTEVDYIGQSEAVRCFVARAQDVSPRFALTPANVRAVAELCMRLDGLPLAIELAAARISLLSPEAMLKRWNMNGDLRLKFLTGGPRDLPVRHQALRTTIAWSYGLLSPVEQRVFARLAVFVGGCTVEAAEDVCGNGTDETLDELQALVENSLVQRVTRRSGVHATEHDRLVMLETVREFALDQLEQCGEAQAMRQRHARYFLRLALTAEPELVRSTQRAWLERLEQEHDNLRAALQWSVRQHAPEHLECALRLASALTEYWKIRGYPGDGRDWWERLLRASENLPDHLRARALSGAGTQAWMQSDFTRATELHTAALALYRRLGDTAGIATALQDLGAQAMERGDLASAIPLYDECIVLRREVGDDAGIASTLSNMGVIAELQGDYVLAAARYEESLALCRKIGHLAFVALVLHNIGEVAQHQGNYARAMAFYEESFAIAQMLDYRHISAELLHKLGNLATVEGKPWRALARLQEGLLLFRQFGNIVGILTCLEGMAAALASTATHTPALARDAVVLWGAVEAQRAILCAVRPLADATFYDPYMQRAHALLDEATYAAALHEGQALSFEATVERGLNLALHEPMAVPNVAAPRASAHPQNLHTLSEREREVLQLVSRGHSDKEVAALLVISPRTVQTHLTSIYSKLAVNSRHAATIFALEHGLVSPAVSK